MWVGVKGRLTMRKVICMPTVLQGLGFLGDAVLLCGDFCVVVVRGCLSLKPDRGWLHNTRSIRKS